MANSSAVSYFSHKFEHISTVCNLIGHFINFILFCFIKDMVFNVLGCMSVTALLGQLPYSFPEFILIGWKLLGAGTPLTTWQLDIPEPMVSKWG